MTIPLYEARPLRDVPKCKTILLFWTTWKLILSVIESALCIYSSSASANSTSHRLCSTVCCIYYWERSTYKWTSAGQGFILQRSTIIGGGGWEIELLYIRKYLLLLLFKEIKNIFSVSISTIINIERHDPQKLFIVLKNFWECKRVLRPNIWGWRLRVSWGVCLISLGYLLFSWSCVLDKHLVSSLNKCWVTSSHSFPHCLQLPIVAALNEEIDLTFSSWLLPFILNAHFPLIKGQK